MFAQNKKFLYIAGGIFVALIIGLVILVVTSNKNTAKKNQGSNELVVWGTGDNKKALEPTINLFQSKNPSIKVVYEKKDSATYLKDSLAEIAAGKGPDVWIVPNDWMVKYHNQMTQMPDNLIANSREKKSDTEVYQQMYPQAIYQDNVFDNKIYGMPLAVDKLVLFYNPTIFSQTINEYNQTHPQDQKTNLNRLFNEGPKNWDDIVAMKNLITQKSGDNITRSAIALGNTSNIGNSADILTLMMLQDGAKMTSDDHLSATFQTKQAQFGSISYPGTTALQFYASFANSQNANYTWNNSLPDSVRAFAEEKVAMLLGYESQSSEIKRINPNLIFSKTSAPQIKETTNPVNYASYNTFTVSKAATNPTLAWQFINSLVDNNNLQNYLIATNQTSAKLSGSPDDPNKTLATWYIPDPEKTPEIFKAMIDQVNVGKNAQTAIENAASQITTLLLKLTQ